MRDSLGRLLKGHAGLNNVVNSGSFVKGQKAWNKGVASPWTSERNRLGKGLPGGKRGKEYATRVIVNCEICFKPIRRKKSLILNHVLCGKKCTLIWRKTRSFRKAQALRTSISQKKVWKSKEYRNRISLIRKSIWKNPEFIKKRSEASIKSWKSKKRHKTASERMRGKNHPNWQGGKSFEDYGGGFTPSLRESIRFRDGYRCQGCGCPQLENKRALIVHHKDCNKKNNTFNNLITLCSSCHVTLHWKIKKGEKQCV